TSFGRRGRLGWFGRYASRQISILDISRRDGGLAARLYRSLILPGGRVASLVGAECRGGSGSRDRNRHVAVAKTREAEACLQGGSLIRKRRRTAFEVDTGGIDERHCDGGCQESEE